MKKETKSLLFLGSGLALLELGGDLQTHSELFSAIITVVKNIATAPTNWIAGLIIGGIGIIMFVIGAYYSVDTVVKTIKLIVKDVKLWVKNKTSI